MKLIAFIFVLSGLLASAQFDTLILKRNLAHYGSTPRYQVDTFADDGNMTYPPFLVGTTVLPGTGNQLGLKNFNLILDSVKFTPCNSEPPITELIIDDTSESETDSSVFNNFEYYRIQSISMMDTSLSIDIKIWENCCHHFLCDATVLDDSVLSLIYYSYGRNYCSCDCCFGLTYFFNFMGGQEEEFKNIKWVIIDDMSKTILPLSSFTE
ncbi:MAG TPA: hypothetical protein PLA88_07740 [Bacteroidales bacterium]|nr:hypothetical protein [Bacteroidales bacterium]